MNGHTRKGGSSDDKDVEFEALARPLRTWLERSAILGERELRELLARLLWPVCYGGMWAVCRAAVHARPVSVWLRLSELLSRGNNIKEGQHYAERLWAAWLGPPLWRHSPQPYFCARLSPM
jgi:hypothetical protein